MFGFEIGDSLDLATVLDGHYGWKRGFHSIDAVKGVGNDK